MQRGELIADGRVGRSLRFSEDALDAFVRRGSLVADSAERDVLQEVLDANQAIESESNAHCGYQRARLRSLPRRRDLERPEDRAANQTRGDRVDARRRARQKARAPRRDTREAYQREI